MDEADEAEETDTLAGNASRLLAGMCAQKAQCVWCAQCQSEKPLVPSNVRIEHQQFPRRVAVRNHYVNKQRLYYYCIR